MYDITKTRMLLTTAVFAAVAALFACGGANAMLLVDGGYRGGALLFTAATSSIPQSGRQWRPERPRQCRCSRAATSSIPQSGRQWRPERPRQCRCSRAATSSIPQSGRQWRRAAEIAQASIGIGVEAAELTRPCSPQESREAC